MVRQLLILSGQSQAPSRFTGFCYRVPFGVLTIWRQRCGVPSRWGSPDHGRFFWLILILPTYFAGNISCFSRLAGMAPKCGSW
jgi:hypothetical protein